MLYPQHKFIIISQSISFLPPLWIELQSDFLLFSGKLNCSSNENVICCWAGDVLASSSPCTNKHRETQLQLQRKIQQKNEVQREQKRKMQVTKSAIV